MKKSLLLGIAGLAAAAATSYGQGLITLDNYTSYGPLTTYGVGVPANGVSGAMGVLGTGLNNQWTVGLYFVLGTPSISDPAGTGIPNAALALATGFGSTAQYAGSNIGGVPGEFLALGSFNTGAAVGSTITLELVAYDTAGGSYAGAGYRVHSIPFTMPSVSIIAPTPSTVGQAMIVAGITGLTVEPVPEPTTLALGALGGLSLLLFRRKNT